MRMVLAAAAALVFTGSAEAAPALEDYGRLPAVERMTLSPSGEQIALIAVVGENRRVVTMSATGKPRLTIAIGDLNVRSVAWAGEDHLLVTNSQMVNLPLIFASKYELGTRMNVDLNAKTARSVFARDVAVYPAVLGDYGVQQVDGHWFGFFGAITLDREDGVSHLNHTFADLYRVDLESGAVRRQAQGDDVEHDWVIGADGEVKARSDYVNDTRSWRLFAGGRRLMERDAPLDEVSVEGLGRTSDTVLVADGTGEHDVVEEQPLAGGPAVRLFQDVTPERFLHARNSRLLIGAVVEEPQRVVLFDAKSQARFNGARKALAGYQVALVSHTDDFGRMILFTDGGDDSGTYWPVDIATGKATPIGAAYPTVEAKDVGPTRMISYKAADGLALDGVLTLPPGKEAKNLPVVVMPHGGPIGPYDRVGFDWWAQAFASRGYAVFQPNYRGSGGHGQALHDAGYGQFGRKMLSDISDGLAAIVAQGLVDPRRACIVGGSYGGYAALAGVTLQHGLYRCAVSYAGPSDLQSMLYDSAQHSGDRSSTVRFWRAAMGVKNAGDPQLDKLSPASHAEQADAPILLIHGKDDTVVAPAQTAKMEAALKRADKPVEVVILPGEDHWMSHQDTRIATLKASVAFVEKHNPAN